MSKVCSIHHVVINTKNRQMTIPMESREALYQYITAIIRDKGSQLMAVGGISNHVHLLIDLNATTALCDLMKVVKQSTSKWMKTNSRFPNFVGWGREYFAFSVSPTATPSVKGYIANQVKHHMGASFEDEMRKVFDTLGEEWHDYLLT